MAVNLTNVDSIEAGSVLVPAGEYFFQVEKAEEKVSKKGDEMILAHLRILEGDYQDIVIKHYFTWSSDWSKKFCKAFAEAAGVPLDNFSADSIAGSMPFRAKVEVEAGTPYIDNTGEEKIGYDTNKINPFSFKNADLF